MKKKTIKTKIEDEIVGAFMETIGTLWGVQMKYDTWSDRDKCFVNNRICEIRNKLLKKVGKLV